MATNLNLSREGDNKPIIHLCVSEMDPPWESGSIISDIRRMVALGHFSVLWCPRTANGAAHWTARAFWRNSLPVSWVSSPPDGLCDLMEQYPINHNESMVRSHQQQQAFLTDGSSTEVASVPDRGGFFAK